MMNLIRREPFQEMAQLHQDMNRLFNQWLNLNTTWSGNGSTVREYPLALDVLENEDEFTVLASIPGVDPNNLDITLTSNVLTIQGESKPDQEWAQGQLRLQERPYGRFVRSITLPATVEDDQIQADYHNGVLTVHVPKSEQAKPKRIAVNAHQVIEG